MFTRREPTPSPLPFYAPIYLISFRGSPSFLRSQFLAFIVILAYSGAIGLAHATGIELVVQFTAKLGTDTIDRHINILLKIA